MARARDPRVIGIELAGRADRARVAPAGPPSAGWSTKIDPQERARQRRDQAAAQERGDRARERWARRHPDAAAAERKLRKSRIRALERWKHKNDGTPETHEHASRTRQGALARLYRDGGIDGEQLAAALEIAAVHERIGADVAVKTASLETRVDMTRLGDGSFYERLAQVRREVSYTRWRTEVAGPIGAVLAMIVGEGGEAIGFSIVARRYRMHKRRAKRLLVDALDLWWRIHGAVRKEIDDASLAAAHAGILS